MRARRGERPGPGGGFDSSCGPGSDGTARADRRSSSALAIRSSAIRSSNFPVTILRTTAAANDVAAMVSDNTSASGTRATVRERNSEAGVTTAARGTVAVRATSCG